MQQLKEELSKVIEHSEANKQEILNELVSVKSDVASLKNDLQ